MVGYIPDMIFDKELDYLSEIGADKVTLGSNSVSVQLGFLREGGGADLGAGQRHQSAAGVSVEKSAVFHPSFQSFYLRRGLTGQTGTA